MSSANWWKLKLCLLINFSKSPVKRVNSNGPRTEPCETLSFPYSLSFIAVSKSFLSRLVSSVSWLIKFRAGLPLVFLPHLGYHNINLLTTSLLRKQCPAKLTLCVAIVLVIFGNLSYSTLLLIRCGHFTLFTTLSTFV